MTVEQRDGQFLGAVQSLRGETWKTVVLLDQTASQSEFQATRQTQMLASEVGCVFVPPASENVECAA